MSIFYVYSVVGYIYSIFNIFHIGYMFICGYIQNDLCHIIIPVVHLSLSIG